MSKPEGRRPSGSEHGLRVLAVVLAVTVVADLSLAVFEANRIPLASRDAVVVAGGFLVLVGMPLVVGGAILSAMARRLPPRWTARLRPVWMTLPPSLGLALLVVSFRADPADLLYVRRHLILALVLCGAPFLLRVRRLLPAVAAGAAALVSAAALSGWHGELSWRPKAPPAERAGRATRGHEGRLLLVGVDGLCWETLERWERRGGSPDLEWLRARGSLMPLETVQPTLSPLIWTTIATGLSPEEHGIVDFTGVDISGVERPLPTIPRLQGAFYWLRALERLRLARSRPVSSREVRRPPLWEMIRDRDRPFDVVGWWATWPAQALLGRMVSDRFFFWREQEWGSPPPAYGNTFPPGLENDLRSLRVPPEDLGPGVLRAFVDLPEEELRSLSARTYEHHEVLSELPMALAMDATYVTVAERLLEDGHPTGLMALYLRGVDLVSHSALRYSRLYPEVPKEAEELRRYGSVVSRYYRHAFRLIRGIVERAGPGTLTLVVSDHGFERVGERKFGHDSAPPGVLLVLSGEPGLEADRPPRIQDVTPTVLWLAGFPVAGDMHGRPLTELFPRQREAIPVLRTATYGHRGLSTGGAGGDGDETEQEMMELLRTLGYID